MDQRSTEQERKRQLIKRLDASRAQIQISRQQFREKLHPLRRLRGAVKTSPLRAFGIAAGAAFAISLIRRRSSSRPTTFKRLLFRWGLSLAKPTIRLWLFNLAKERFLTASQAERNEYQANTP